MAKIKSEKPMLDATLGFIIFLIGLFLVCGFAYLFIKYEIVREVAGTIFFGLLLGLLALGVIAWFVIGFMEDIFPDLVKLGRWVRIKIESNIEAFRSNKVDNESDKVDNKSA